jgi:hypothetical protein
MMQPKQPSQHASSWRKASYCVTGECVEVAEHNGMIVLRDSKQPCGAALIYTAEEWHSFLRGIKNGEFDHFG